MISHCNSHYPCHNPYQHKLLALRAARTVHGWQHIVAAYTIRFCTVIMSLGWFLDPVPLTS
jgi:hypothetical protein